MLANNGNVKSNNNSRFEVFVVLFFEECALRYTHTTRKGTVATYRDAGDTTKETMKAW